MINSVIYSAEVNTYVFIIDAADEMYERGLRVAADRRALDGPAAIGV